MERAEALEGPSSPMAQPADMAQTREEAHLGGSRS